MSGLQCLLVTFASALLLGIAHCQEKPTIVFVSQEQIHDVGSSAELVCKVQNSQDYPVIWIKLGKTEAEQLIISTGGTLVLRDHRYSMRVNESTSTYKLRIDDIRETDAGFYQCQIVESVSSRVKADVELKLRLSPIISNNSTKSLVVREGQSPELECYAEGYPKPEISWRRANDAKLPNGNSVFYGNVLRIDEVQWEHRGVYYCMANNGVGDRGVRRAVVLEVAIAPTVEAEQPRVGQALQQKVALVCHVIGYPPPVVTWYKDQEQLAYNRHYVMTKTSTDGESYDRLRIIGIEKEDFGDYVCRATNDLGTAEAKVHLFEIETSAANDSTTPHRENKASP